MLAKSTLLLHHRNLARNGELGGYKVLSQRFWANALPGLINYVPKIGNSTMSG